MAIEPTILEQGRTGSAASDAIATEDVAQGGLVRAAAVLAAGNVASRVLGLARETVIAYLFGATGYVSIFRVAATIIQTLYDFLVGGMVSAALVPIFSELADLKTKEELWHVASVVMNALAVVLALAVLFLELLAPQLVWMLGAGYDTSLQAAAVDMIRLVLPAVFFLGMSGTVTGLLFALKRYSYPAFTAVAYNAAIVIVALVLAPLFGIMSLIVGILLGSSAQVFLQLPGLRDMRYRPLLDLSHPTLRRILRLYAPVLAGLTISVVGVVVDRNLASFTGEQSLAWMQNATVLIQFPLGLIGTAISFAILPELSRRTQKVPPSVSGAERSPDGDSGFQSTLAFGIKLVLLLILPATVGLFVLARPIVALLFERGAFTPTDTFWTSTALRVYLIGLPFAAIDQPLVFAFYARKNTIAPNVVQFAAVGIYTIVAFALVRSYGMIGLVLANSAQLSGHALLMLWLTLTRLGGLRGHRMIATTSQIASCSVAVGLLSFALLGIVEKLGGGDLWQVVVPSVGAMLLYAGLLRLLRVQEATRLWDLVRLRARIV